MTSSAAATALYGIVARTSHHDLLRDVDHAAVTYAHHRATWALASAAERREMDPSRTAAHNAFIDACNILSRAMARSAEDSSWRATLGDDRKVIGDFACHIHCQLAISAR
jgi:hypothetical protein